MIEINLRHVLDEGQNYVAEFRDEYGIGVRAFRYNVATTSCYEKLDVLRENCPDEDWTADRIVKAVFFAGSGKLYGVIFPELGTREKPKYVSKNDLARILGKEKKEVNSFHNSLCPEGMEKGTCTPFVPEYVFEDDSYSMLLKKVFVYEPFKKDSRLIDISIGGYGEEAHKTSVQLPADEMCNIMESKFGDKVSFVDLFN